MVEKRLKLAPNVTSGQDASTRQRKALHTLLAKDEEYGDLASYINIDDAIGENISKELEVEPIENAKRLYGSPQNIMKVLQYDIQGYPVKLIATQLGISEMGVSRIKASESYAAARAEVLGSVIEGARKYMEVATVKAVKTLIECLDSNNEKVRLTAAQDVLTRTGLSAPQQIEITNNVNNFGNYTDDELLEIMKKEKVIPSGAEVIDVADKEPAE
jgi:hypothetical protein